MSNKQAFFTAGSGRSGTTSIMSFIVDNLPNCTALHEPGFKPHSIKRIVKKYQFPQGVSISDVKGFRNTITWYDNDDPKYWEVIRFRANRINEIPGDLYFEANHAFLKSLWKGMLQCFPRLKLVYLVRHPFEVSESFLNKGGSKLEEKSISEHYFNRRNLRPGLKKNVLPLTSSPSAMTFFQKYLWTWLEVELRYARFKEEHPEVPVFEMQTSDLNNKNSLISLLEFFGYSKPEEDVILPGMKNANSHPTQVSSSHQKEAKELLHTIPRKYLLKLPTPFDLLELRG